MSLDEIKRKRAEDVASRDKTLESTKKDLKDRNQKKIQKKLDTKKAAPKAAAPKGGKNVSNAPGAGK
jgi:hypothetical protein